MTHSTHATDSEHAPVTTPSEVLTASAIRTALQRAADDLLEGRIPGPLTGVRLAEAAGVKRHRLTHDNADINVAFQERARSLNHHKPDVERLRAALAAEKSRRRHLTQENAVLVERLSAYASVIMALTEERDQLRMVAASPKNLTAIRTRGD